MLVANINLTLCNFQKAIVTEISSRYSIIIQRHEHTHRKLLRIQSQKEYLPPHKDNNVLPAVFKISNNLNSVHLSKVVA